jgi:hypothetical protein
MKKEIIRYGALFIVISLFAAATLPAFAHLEPDLNSFWAFTPPTINGTMVPGEWADAATRTFQLFMRSRGDGSLQNTLDAILYEKNDYTNEYFAVQIFNDTYWATDFANRWKGFAMLFDNNHNGVVEQGENGEGITTWTGSPFYSKNDLYYDAVGGLWDADVNAGGTNDGAIKFSHTNPVSGQLGDWTFEGSIPLVGSDPGYDFNILKAQLPKTLGFKVWFYDQAKGWDGVYPDEPTIPINLDEVANGATYGTLIKHPLYYLTIAVNNAAWGTTSPVPGVYAYGYGTVVSVTASPYGGYVLDYWKLDMVNVGSANPYSVTMNQNHTLTAFFKIKPVGGISVSLKQTALLPSIALYSMMIAIFGAAVCIVRRKKR